MANPSIFSSHTKRAGAPARPRSTRAPQARSSASPKALSRLIIGTRWRTGANVAETAPDTRWVGESGVTRAGYCSSKPCSSRTSASNSASLISGSSSW